MHGGSLASRHRGIGRWRRHQRVGRRASACVACGGIERGELLAEFPRLRQIVKRTGAIPLGNFMCRRHDQFAGAARTAYNGSRLAPGDPHQLLAVGTAKTYRHVGYHSHGFRAAGVVEQAALPVRVRGQGQARLPVLRTPLSIYQQVVLEVQRILGHNQGTPPSGDVGRVGAPGRPPCPVCEEMNR
jgi:hypothetical protein